jgi:hypothetical protein
VLRPTDDCAVCNGIVHPVAKVQYCVVLELPDEIRMAGSTCNSPARSIGDPNSLTDSELTDLESDSQIEVLTEVPGTPDQTIVDGWVKFRDNKRVRICVLLYVMPAAHNCWGSAVVG